jgi:hypothetical protein
MTKNQWTLLQKAMIAHRNEAQRLGHEGVMADCDRLISDLDPGGRFDPEPATLKKFHFDTGGGAAAKLRLCAEVVSFDASGALTLIRGKLRGGDSTHAICEDDREWMADAPKVNYIHLHVNAAEIGHADIDEVLKLDGTTIEHKPLIRRPTVIDDAEVWDSNGTLALMRNGWDMLYLTICARPAGEANDPELNNPPRPVFTDAEHQQIIDTIVAALRVEKGKREE